MWWFYALLSALFAALTAIFAKVGVEDVDSNLATAIRTVVENLDKGTLRVAEPVSGGWQVNEWVKKAEVDGGRRAGVPTEVTEKMKTLERENRELRQANEILRKASAYFAMAELDRRSK